MLLSLTKMLAQGASDPFCMALHFWLKRMMSHPSYLYPLLAEEHRVIGWHQLIQGYWSKRWELHQEQAK
jgi:hypothetical protein